MQLAETLVLRRYHLRDNTWTPLRGDPCWKRCSLRLCKNRSRCKVLLKSHVSRLHSEVVRVEFCPDYGDGKSATDDCVYLGIVGAESGLCATIHWDSSRRVQICHSFIIDFGIVWKAFYPGHYQQEPYCEIGRAPSIIENKQIHTCTSYNYV